MCAVPLLPEHCAMSLIIDILKPYRIIDRVLDEIFSYAPKIWWLDGL